MKREVLATVGGQVVLRRIIAVLFAAALALASTTRAQNKNAALHFKLLPDGGYIQAMAISPQDSGVVVLIRVHFREQTKKFSAGAFGLTGLSPDLVPPGMAQMDKLKAMIRYEYQDIDSGGRLRISSKDPAAIAAIHDFLRFEIRSNKTNDPMAVDQPQ